MDPIPPDARLPLACSQWIQDRSSLISSKRKARPLHSLFNRAMLTGALQAGTDQFDHLSEFRLNRLQSNPTLASWPKANLPPPADSLLPAVLGSSAVPALAFGLGLSPQD